jgi:hypothetical protein
MARTPSRTITLSSARKMVMAPTDSKGPHLRRQCQGAAE